VESQPDCVAAVCESGKEIVMKTDKETFKKAADYFGYLYDRWQDEKEYEDFSDYQTAIKKNLPKGAEFISMTKKPFCVKFTWRGISRFMKADAKTVTFGRCML
jgi:hypothetical protein